MTSRARYLDASSESRPRKLSINTQGISNVRQYRTIWTGRSPHRLRLFCYIIFGMPLFFYSWLVLFSDRLSEVYVSPDLLKAERILWLVAHPDDESMFFAPSILNLLSEHSHPNGSHVKPTGHILSLSAGNAEGLGKHRTAEMRASCWMLGMTSEHCIVLDQETLPDSMDAWWAETVVEYWTRVYIEKWGIDLIITFDENGVSGHANHRAINAAMVKAANVDLSFPTVFTLRTARSVLTKYTSLFSYLWVRMSHRWRMGHPLPKLTWDPKIHPIAAQKHAFLPDHPQLTKDHLRNPYLHPFSSHSSLLVNSPFQYFRSRGAFKQHKSQDLWFRKLYMFASRYMWFNELQKVVRIHERIVDLGKIREAAKVEV